MFILCGIADEPTCPGLNPSVTSSGPTISLIEVATLLGAATTWASAGKTSTSSDRGYTCPVAGEHSVEPQVWRHSPFQLGELRGVAAQQVEHVLRSADRPLMPRSG